MGFSSNDLPFFLDTNSEFYDVVDSRSPDKKLVDEVRHLRNEAKAIFASQAVLAQGIAEQERSDRLWEEEAKEIRMLEHQAMAKAKTLATIAASRYSDEQKALEVAQRVFEQVFTKEKDKLLEEKKRNDEEVVRKAIEEHQARLKAEEDAEQSRLQAIEDAKQAKRAAAAKRREERKEKFRRFFSSILTTSIKKPKKPMRVEKIGSMFKQITTGSFWSSLVRLTMRGTVKLLKAAFLLFLCFIIVVALIMLFV